MIIDKTIKIKITNNKKYYNNIEGLYNIKNGDIIEIPIEFLYKGSYQKIHVKCDVCGNEKNLAYKYYLKNIKNYNYYCCSHKCAQNKTKITNNKKYGTDSVSQNIQIKEKIKKTNLERYGVESHNQSKIIKEKKKRSNLEKYGVENISQNDKIKEKKKKSNLERYGVENVSKKDKIKEKIKKTNLERYGVEHPSQNKDIREKTKQGFLEKYNVENPSQNKDVKEKRKQTFLEKYGVENISQNEKIKEKIKKSNLEKYGYENVFQNEKIKEKIKKSNLEKYGSIHYLKSETYKEKYINDYIQKYNILPDDRNLQYKIYRNQITCLTNKNKKKLLEIWDGYDFYDGEYIRENFNLSYINKNYPTIDHKISVYYGFMNNISPEEISKIENLCFTKRTLNSKKQEDCYEGKEKS